MALRLAHSNGNPVTRPPRASKAKPSLLLALAARLEKLDPIAADVYTRLIQHSIDRRLKGGA